MKPRYTLDLLIEITRSGQSFRYRWYRFRELIGLPDRHGFRKTMKLLFINRQIRH